MKIQQVRVMAKNLGVNSVGKSKIELVREIQRREGNFDCYGTSKGYCDQEACCFRVSCLKEGK
jgi:hypothetical protein